MIVAAEASSSLFALRLIQHWKLTHPDIKTFGVGSKEMQDEGFERFGKSEEMAVVGATEIIEHYQDIKKVFYQLIDATLERQPQIVILMDYPEFNMALAKRLSSTGLKLVYYVTPQIWAWRQGRVKAIKKHFSEVFVLFPFEVPFYEKCGVKAQFLGHPILDEFDDELLDAKRQKLKRSSMGLGDQDILLGLMPGSRKSEIKLNFPLQLEVARRLMSQEPRMKLMILVAPTVEKEQLLPFLEDFKLPYILLKEKPFDMISLPDLILATSGTATLMVGLLEKPMVIMYRFKWLTALIVKLLVRGTRFFGIVNLIFDNEVVPERWQEKATPDELTKLLTRYLKDENYTRSVKNKLSELRLKLGNKGATARVAAELEKYLPQNPKIAEDTALPHGPH